MRSFLLGLCLVVFASPASCDPPWVADLGDGTFKNPVLFADYSDPDAVRVGDDVYMTASSFNCVPALPILHSRDLVNWTIVGHAVERLPERFDTVQHGNGIWAPSIRYHDGWYYIYVGDPDWGILMTRAQQPTGPWEPLHVVREGKGLIDPCPLWDDDGRAYLVHAYARSRSGIKSILVVREMSPDGRSLIGDEHLVIDGRDEVHPTIEGPKFYKRDGWYYILAPAGGVKPGWQLAARSRNVLGPYEVRRVLEQGGTEINGPHQGAWIEMPSGESWFLHFQDRDAYGRLVHLNPVEWRDGWPHMGIDYDSNGVGEPVARFVKPEVEGDVPIAVPQTSDDFDGRLNLAWQWQANPQQGWASLDARSGWLRLFAQQAPTPSDLTTAPHALLQKFPAPEFSATAKIDVTQLAADSKLGLVIMGLEYAGLFVTPTEQGYVLVQRRGAQGESTEQAGEPATVTGGELQLRVDVVEEAVCRFSYSSDGRNFYHLGGPFTAAPGRWIGAKVGLLALGDAGSADIDWFRIDKLETADEP